jgi:hypothetical protein
MQSKTSAGPDRDVETTYCDPLIAVSGRVPDQLALYSKVLTFHVA